MDDWQLLLNELGRVLSNGMPRELMPMMADYVRSRKHAWMVVARHDVCGPSNWRIQDNIAEKTGPKSTGHGIRSLYSLADGPTTWNIYVSLVAGADQACQFRASVGVIDSADYEDEDRGSSYLLTVGWPADGVIVGVSSDIVSAHDNFRIRITADQTRRTVVAQFTDPNNHSAPEQLLLQLPASRDFGALRPFVRLWHEAGTVTIL